jgi:hypothetical protein
MAASVLSRLVLAGLVLRIVHGLRPVVIGGAERRELFPCDPAADQPGNGQRHLLQLSPRRVIRLIPSTIRTLIVVGRSDVVQLRFCVICHAVARPIGGVKRASSGGEFRKRRPKILPSYGSAQILANGVLA